MEKRRSKWLLPLLVFVSVVVIYILIQAFSGLYPFGEKSNLLWDQDVQYVDFFAFYKDVLTGKGNIGYSFSKSAGGSLIALFGYYLGCPLNLLVVFFEKEQLPLFIFLLTAVKLGLSAVTANIYFSKRFPGLSMKLSGMLSVAYGLMQYNMRQSSNIMWLDGVILLPLLLLAVYEFIQYRKKTGLFLAVLFSIGINWYTGYMTGLFAVIYFLYERGLKCKNFCRKEIKDFIVDGFLCAGIMLAGVLGSGFIFWPVVKGLQNGKEAFDSSIFDYATHGSFLDVFQGFAVGGLVSTVSLYCGLIFLAFFFYYFISGRRSIKEKMISAFVTVVMFTSCWLVPLDCIWSGFRQVQSFAFRYSFVVTFLVLYLSAQGGEDFEKEKKNWKMLSIFLLCIVGVGYFYLKNRYDEQVFSATIGFLILYLLVFVFLKKVSYVKNLIPFFLAAELLVNGILTFTINYGENGSVSDFQDYVTNEKKLVEQVMENEDDLFYRMDTLEKRNDSGTKLSAYLNEAMAYGYRSLSHYSSAYDTDVNRMVYDLGYSSELVLGGMDESILTSDSLFGVKYLLSKKDVPGYIKMDNMDKYNDKSVYYNPYSLGIGMETEDTVFENAESLDPFAFQNQLFSNILGRNVELFKRVDASMMIENNTLNFTVQGPEGANMLYGYVDSWIQNLQLYIDGEYRCDYATWLGYKVFYIGQGNGIYTITLANYTGTDQEVFPYFYYLDQEVFEKIIDELHKKELQLETFEDGYVSGSYTAAEDGWMLFTIPYDAGWEAYVNGERVEVLGGANALTVIPVEKGRNQIELKYHVPGVKEGWILTMVGICLFLVLCKAFSKRNLP